MERAGTRHGRRTRDLPPSGDRSLGVPGPRARAAGRLALAITGVRALTEGFSFRLSIIADHELDRRWFGFDRSDVDGALDLWLDAGTATAPLPVHLQRGGGGAGRYEFDFWAPPVDQGQGANSDAAVIVSWTGEGVPPTAAPIDLTAVDEARAYIVKITGTPIQYPDHY